MVNKIVEFTTDYEIPHFQRTENQGTRLNSIERKQSIEADRNQTISPYNKITRELNINENSGRVTPVNDNDRP